MKVLVTGGLGYLGSVLVKKLIDQGFEVKVLDSLLYGNFLSKESDSFELIKGDVRDERVMLDAVKDVDAVLHLAGIIGDTAADLDKELTIDVNYLATLRLAELCKKKNVKLVFSSTCSVYGVQSNQAVTEKSKVAPLSLYAFSKLLSEEAITKRCSKYVIFRLGTLFGLSPRMRFDLVANKFIMQAIQEGEITIYGGEQYRPFVHLQDVSDFFIRALEVDTNGIYNVGGNNYKIMEVAERLKKKLECKITIVRNQLDQRNYAVNSTLAKKVFGNKNFREIEFAINEIKSAYKDSVIKDYRDSIYYNEKWLKSLWRRE